MDDDASTGGADETAPKPPLPSHVILLDDCAEHLAGNVLRADADLIAQLDAGHFRYRAASDHERALAGFD
jgi:hypothetical protein